MASDQDSTGGTTRTKGEAARATTGVGGVRSSDDSVPDLHWSGELTEERRDATCSAEVKSSKDVVTAREGYQHPIKFGSCKSRCIGKRSPNRSTGSGVCTEKCNALTCWQQHGGA